MKTTLILKICMCLKDKLHRICWRNFQSQLAAAAL